MSQPPNSSWLMFARGTKSAIFGVRLSVRLPSRMVPICVSDPTGTALPCRASRTPAIVVVATAPIPGSSTPSLPSAGRSDVGFFMGIPLVRSCTWRTSAPVVAPVASASRLGARPDRSTRVVPPLVPRAVEHGDIVAPQHAKGVQGDSAGHPTITVDHDLPGKVLDVDAGL